MADDIRYAELRFLQMLPSGNSDAFNHNDERVKNAVGLHPTMYFEMILTLMEELYIYLESYKYRILVSKLRGESGGICPSGIGPYDWDHPREALAKIFLTNEAQRIRLTYRGLRRIEELREILARDQILDPFGVLLDKRYLHRDLEDALGRSADIPVSVIYADLDNFKRVNDNFGHAAGDLVLKAYLEVVRDTLGLLGTGYRVGGDETVSLVIGLGHQRAFEIAEAIRGKVEGLACEYKGQKLPSVTTSIGVASTPPETRTAEIGTLADARNKKAKEAGKNRVVER